MNAKVCEHCRKVFSRKTKRCTCGRDLLDAKVTATVMVPHIGAFHTDIAEYRLVHGKLSEVSEKGGREMILSTTKRLLRKYKACEDRYNRLCEKLGPRGDNEPITLLEVLKHNGIEDALWALRAVPKSQRKLRDKIERILAYRYAKHVLPIYEERYPNDSSIRKGLKVIKKYIDGNASEELRAARDTAADAATYAIDAAAAGAATYAADTAAYAAVDAAAARTKEQRYQARVFRDVLKEEASFRV